MIGLWPGFSIQPGWAALPLGLLELGATMGLVQALSIETALVPAIGLFVGAWLVAQLLTHAGYPLPFPSYGDSAGEMVRSGKRPRPAIPTASAR